MKTLLKILSYVSAALVGAAAATVVLCLTLNLGRVNKLEQLGNLIESRFIAETDRAEMEDAAAAAMVNSLGDRWSHYLTAEAYAANMEQLTNAYVGVGMTVTAREDGDGIDIVQVTPGGPAEEAGIQAGDVLIAVNGEAVDGLDVAGVSLKVKGEEGTFVELTMRRETEALTKKITFTVERRTIQVVVAEGEMITDQIGLITITNFDDRCASETIAALEQLLKDGAKSIIFDVRNNPGGFKHELVALLDYILPEGPLFRSEMYTGATSVDNSDADCVSGIPMVVLVNENSYSAAEFFAAALEEYDYASIVGEQTSGKGYFQQTFQLADGSGVALSVGKYCTPKGISLAEAGGLVPDLIVDVDDETAAEIYVGILDTAEDPQIQAAIELLK